MRVQMFTVWTGALLPCVVRQLDGRLPFEPLPSQPQVSSSLASSKATTKRVQLARNDCIVPEVTPENWAELEDSLPQCTWFVSYIFHAFFPCVPHSTPLYMLQDKNILAEYCRRGQRILSPSRQT